MHLSWDEIQEKAIRFSKRWETARREKADEQPFIIELLGVFGVDYPVKVGERQKEVKVKGETTKWIDYFWKDKIAVEMKSKGEKQIEVNVKAAGKMTKLYNALKELGYEGHELEVYLVRLLFCLFANDTGIFPKDHFYNYIEQSKIDGSDLSHRIAGLFEVLNMPDNIRNKKTMLSGELKRFSYINGNLFALRLPPADFNAKMRQTLIECLDFDWSKISPAIFGAMFQGVMDEGKRREIGAHYTSEENIEKLINPLFMDDLYKEFERVKTEPAALDQFHNKIARLKFLEIIMLSFIQFNGKFCKAQRCA